jgi:SAM-dependent methyltransferase
MAEPTPAAPDWAKASGDVWARRWRDTDRGLEPLQAPLVSAIAERARGGSLKAFDIGCGPGSTTIAVAKALPDAAIVACDISEALAEVARQRTADIDRVQVIVGDAEAVAAKQAPVDIFFSRHGVMFFSDPVQALRNLRGAAREGGSLVFSCFQDLDLNPWASELAAAAAGGSVPPPGREPGGFAFAEPAYVRELLSASGWHDAECRAVQFSYTMGEGESPVEDAISFMAEIGPAARILESLPEVEREAAVGRMRHIIERRVDGRSVVFPAAAWIWSATA